MKYPSRIIKIERITNRISTNFPQSFNIPSDSSFSVNLNHSNNLNDSSNTTLSGIVECSYGSSKFPGFSNSLTKNSSILSPQSVLSSFHFTPLVTSYSSIVPHSSILSVSSLSCFNYECANSDCPNEPKSLCTHLLGMKNERSNFLGNVTFPKAVMLKSFYHPPTNHQSFRLFSKIDDVDNVVLQQKIDGIKDSSLPLSLFKAEYGVSGFSSPDSSINISSLPTGSSQFDMIIRIIYTFGLYGGMILLGKLLSVICGLSFSGNLQFSHIEILNAILLSIPPILFSFFIRQDFLVNNFPPAKAIRDAEDEEVVDFFYGMKPWQYVAVCVVAATAEELFFRWIVQQNLFHVIHTNSAASNFTYGLSALTGILPSFYPCSLYIAALFSAAIKGSMFYLISIPQSPVILVSQNQIEMHKEIQVWQNDQNLKRIYSPLLETLLSLYLAFEWLAMGNILAPIITHALYSVCNVYSSLNRIEKNRIPGPLD